MRNIFSSLSFVLLFLAFNSYGQSSIKGIVQDAGNQAGVTGVLVEVQGTDYYAQTNSSGNFQINNII